MQILCNYEILDSIRVKEPSGWPHSDQVRAPVFSLCLQLFPFFFSFKIYHPFHYLAHRYNY